MRGVRALPRRRGRGLGRGDKVDRALCALAAGLFGFFLVAAVPRAVLRSVGMLVLAVETAGESQEAARARVFGAAYTAAIDEIRRALPAGGAYLMVEGGRPQDGGVYWVRYDLAPRRAVFFANLSDLTDATRLRHRIPAPLRQVVVSYGPGNPPRLLERYRFTQEIEGRGAGIGAAAGIEAGGRRGGGRAAGPGSPRTATMRRGETVRPARSPAEPNRSRPQENPRPAARRGRPPEAR
jgi:hypothetical protein